MKIMNYFDLLQYFIFPIKILFIFFYLNYFHHIVETSIYFLQFNVYNFK